MTLTPEMLRLSALRRAEEPANAIISNVMVELEEQIDKVGLTAQVVIPGEELPSHWVREKVISELTKAGWVLGVENDITVSFPQDLEERISSEPTPQVSVPTPVAKPKAATPKEKLQQNIAMLSRSFAASSDEDF